MKYRTIVIDPPWRFKPGGNKSEFFNRLKKQPPYETMTDAEIKQFPIHDFADESCALFLWTFDSKLPAALDILKYWKFDFRRCIVWHKNNGLNISGFIGRTEFLLYAARGKRAIRYDGTWLNTCQQYNTTNKHSEKPREIYQNLKGITHEPRIDIFARRRHAGYDAYGDQVENTIQEVLE